MRVFGVETGSGLCELLEGSQNLASSIYQIKEAGIWVLPAGNIKGNALEILQSNKLPVLMEQLASLFDWVVIDSPPILPLADTSVWARLADGILLVARPGVTKKRLLEKGLEAIDKTKIGRRSAEFLQERRRGQLLLLRNGLGDERQLTPRIHRGIFRPAAADPGSGSAALIISDSPKDRLFGVRRPSAESGIQHSFKVCGCSSRLKIREGH